MKKKNPTKSKFVILLLFIFICDNTAFFINLKAPIEKESSTSKDNSYENDIKTPLLPIASAFSYVLIPQTNHKYFSPLTSPGINDEVLYSFGVNQADNYTLNISAYYDPIENFAGSISSDGIESQGYLMPNGTWLVVGLEIRTGTMDTLMHLGIGTNVSNFEWYLVGQIKFTNALAVAGDEMGKIRIVFYETNGSSNSILKEINCFSSDNWGQSWTNTTLMNYTDTRYAEISGISLAAYDGNFTCAWGAAVSNSSAVDTKNSTIIGIEEIHNSWNYAKNISALGGPLNPIFGCRFPQLFYNRTNSNGTLMLVYDRRVSPESEYNEVYILKLANGIHTSVTANWTITIEQTNQGTTIWKPLIYCTKDNNSETFYFLDTSSGGEAEKGIRNAIWGDDVVSKPVDIFQTEYGDPFNIYANNGPKCFSSWALSSEGKRKPGILDCKTPFNVVKIENETAAYEIRSHTFKGRDNNGYSPEAKVYSFNLHISTEFHDLIVYVDDYPVNVTFSPSINYISPFSSVNSQDEFYCNITADKSGTATLNVRCSEPVFGQTIIEEGLTYVSECVLCGDGVNYYLFFTNQDDPNRILLFSKSIDGGLSWSDPKSIDSSLSSYYGEKKAFFTGSEIYLWTQGNLLFTSSDLGETWIKHEQDTQVLGVTNGPTCWHSTTKSDRIAINMSTDYGYSWEDFCTINMTDALEYQLEDVAYDPISGNYSFLFAMNNERNVIFITALNNGTKISVSDNILKDGYFMPDLLYPDNYIGMTEIDVRWINENSTEWIITTCAMNPINRQTYTSDLAYCVSNGSLNFNLWQNFTDINGMNIPTYIIEDAGGWDIIFSKNGAPCHVTGIMGSDWQPEKWDITASSSFIYGISQELDESSPGIYDASLYFYGIQGNGVPLWDTQNLTWICEVVDNAGYKDSESGILYIDNTDPSLLSTSDSIPSKPNLSNDIEILVEISEENPSNASIYYRTSEMTDWTPVNMSMVILNASTLSYTGIIPAQAQSIASVSWYINVSDLCGNYLIVNDNGQDYIYVRPDIRIEEQEEPPATIDLNDVYSFTVSFIVPEYADYVDYLYIEYEYDDGEGTQKEKLKAKGSLFQYTFEDIPEESTILMYKVVAVDIYGNEIELDKEREVNILPKLPSLEMNAGLQIIVSLIALFVGIACSLLYMAVMSSKKSERSLNEELLRTSKKKSFKEMPSSRVSELTSEGKISDYGERKKKTTMGLTGIGLVAFIGLAILSILLYQKPEISIIFLTGAFVLAVTLWVLLSAYTADKALRSTEEISTKRAKIALIGMSFMIYLILLAIFFAGNTITWWRVRVNQQSYIIAGITIPKALTSVTTAFFSSILLLTASTFKQISTKADELKQAQLNNDNPLAVMERRENAVSTVVNNVGQKGIIFTAIIAVVIIFASDLNLYANQAISMVIPFIIGAIATLLITTYFKKKKETPTESLVLDDIIYCPECKSQTALGANYCENCGKEMLHGRRFSKGIQCNNCKKTNAQGMKYCRYCGTSLETERNIISKNNIKIK